ncbi:MAG: trypsin-like peptidase domain-containing protein [Candidatus Loosdrechtia sp.]|uniref:serine protease n=1 Tax=Candidatus Loosdrechtia sp. TaxID=3101272 RepID=UPI003A6CF99A|nr:MAG: trypsin-like peptidase domain-containing protein [Candidatus Jettenia sp. AMX2]
MPHYDIDTLRESMVKILQDDGQTTSGSGFIIREDGYIVTCHHVIYQLKKLGVEYKNQVFDATWCEDLSDPDVDIAVLKIDIENAKTVPIIKPKELQGPVTVYGFPVSKEEYFPKGFDVPAGQIQKSASVNTHATYNTLEIKFNNAWNRLPHKDSCFSSYRIHEKVDPGTSGGPVLAENLDGVVGIVQSSKTGETYIIRWDNILPSLDKLGLEPKKNAICRFLEDIENRFKEIKLFHIRQKILMENQYIPIQVTVERKYRHEIETSWGYSESEEELKRAYAVKGETEESQRTQVPWEDARKEYQKIMVLADPGMGKSTLLQMEALEIAINERQSLREEGKNIEDIIVPLNIKLYDLAKDTREVVDVIPDLVSRDYPKTSKGITGLLKEKLEEGKCTLLLDALDEVPLEHRRELAERLNRFAGNYDCPVICTSRIAGYGGAFLDGAKEVEIVPFAWNRQRIIFIHGLPMPGILSMMIRSLPRD